MKLKEKVERLEKLKIKMKIEEKEIEKVEQKTKEEEEIEKIEEIKEEEEEFINVRVGLVIALPLVLITNLTPPVKVSNTHSIQNKTWRDVEGHILHNNP